MGKEPEFTKMQCVRLRPETVEALQKQADAEQRPLSQYLRIMLEELAARPAKGKK